MAISRFLTAVVLVSTVAYAQVIPPAGRAPFKGFLTGQFSRVAQQKMTILTNQAALDKYWERDMGQPSRTAPSNVDWFQHKVVAVHLGQRPTGGYRLQVQGLDESRNFQATLRLLEVTPAPGTYVSQAITSPWVLVLVDNQIRNLKMSILKAEGTGVVLPGIPGSGNAGPRCNCDCPYCCRD